GAAQRSSARWGHVATTRQTGRCCVDICARNVSCLSVPEVSTSKQKISLGHRQDLGWFAAQQLPVCKDLIGLRIDTDIWQPVVQNHVALANIAAAVDGAKRFGQL